MPAQVRYGKVTVQECPCCVSPPVAFDSEEGRARRRRFIRHYKRVSAVQLLLALVAVVSGATSAGLMAANPAYPYMICYPLISGVLMLIAAVFGRMVGSANVDDQVSAAVKRNVVVHYVLCVVGCTLCMLTAAFSSMGLGYCLSPQDSRHREDCTPHRDLRTVFLAIDILLGFLLFLVCIVGCVLFCMHARTVGFSNRMQNVEHELNALRAQVAALTQAQQAGQFSGVGGSGEGVPPPPPYSQISGPGGYGGLEGSAYYAPQGGSGYGFSGADLRGSSPGKGQLVID